jgi:hypothetical protein
VKNVLLTFCELILATTVTLADRANERKEMKSWWRDPAVTNIFLGLFTCLLVVVGILQWLTLRQTDKTLRVGERAFVYIEGGLDVARNDDGAGNKWMFLFNAVNNGGTETTDLSFFEACQYGQTPEIHALETSFLGPKQKIGMGSCTWRDDIIQTIWANNWSVKMTVSIFYRDTFSGSHFTRVCRRIIPKSDPRNGPPLLHEEDRCQETPDCIDSECFHEVSR